MTIGTAVMTVVVSLVLPWAVQLIKTEAITGNAARLLAICTSLVAGIVTGFVGGIPADPAAWVTCVFAVVGGVQTAYAAFAAIGITSKWLDSLLAVGHTTNELKG